MVSTSVQIVVSKLKVPRQIRRRWLRPLSRACEPVRITDSSEYRDGLISTFRKTSLIKKF